MRSEYVYQDYVSHSYIWAVYIYVDKMYGGAMRKIMEEHMIPDMKQNGRNALKNIVD